MKIKIKVIEFIEFKHMLQLSIIIINCALNRKESRGAHFRIDYPKTEKNYEKITLAQMHNDVLELNFQEKV